MLDGWLDFHRATLLSKCEGLSDEQLTTRPVPPSALTLLGLVRHMTDVERGWCLPFLGRPAEPLYATEEDPDGEFDVTEADPATDLARFRAETQAIRAALEEHELDEVEVTPSRTLSLRWICTHLLEEYARHNGHADLLREALDGRTGM
ncbi:MAG TPA: DinB family protein [Nocardioidaceae bacterium]|nr:DinB family protein [Nocardioidaceae bacterium]